jgi:hypothetical protein
VQKGRNRPPQYITRDPQKKCRKAHNCHNCHQTVACAKRQKQATTIYYERSTERMSPGSNKTLTSDLTFTNSTFRQHSTLMYFVWSSKQTATISLHALAFCNRDEGSGCYSSASHLGGPGTIPGQLMWDLWWTKWHWDRFFPRVLRFSPVNFIPPVLHYTEK